MQEEKREKRSSKIENGNYGEMLNTELLCIVFTGLPIEMDVLTA